MNNNRNPRISMHIECLYAVGILNSRNFHYYCMTCFDRLGIASILELEMVASHYFVKGPYQLYFCSICRKNIVRTQPVTQCALCINRCFRLLNNLRSAGVDPECAIFSYNIFKDTLVRIRID